MARSNAKGSERAFAEERKRDILKLLAKDGKVMVRALSQSLGVSAVSVRSYLRDLEAEGRLLRTHGGALARSKTGFELASAQRQVSHLAAKRRIAVAAARLIEDGDTVVLDTGTTTLELARLLVERRRLTVVTNDLDIARILEDGEGVQVLVMGGLLRRGFHCTIGVQGRDLVAGLTADKAFMGANGVSPVHGASTPDLGHAATKRAMAGLATTVVVLCDSSKLGKAAFARFAEAKDIDVLVTEAIDDKARRAFVAAGIEVLVAEV